MTEVFGDIALAIPPVDEREVEELLGRIRSKQLLGAFRGQPAVDRRRLIDVVLAVARIAEEHPQIAEIDVSPLIIAGDRPVATLGRMAWYGDHRRPYAAGCSDDHD
jgi:ATP-grasp domain